MPYVGSYFYNKDNSVNISDFVIIMPIGQLSNSVFSILVGYTIRYIYPFWILLFGSSFTLVSMFFCSYITNPYFFCWAYGLTLGAIISFMFLPSVWILWDYFPANKGKISGIVLAAGSFGPVIFNSIIANIVNPYNYEATTVEVDGQEKQKVFGTFVSERVPMTIRWLALISLFFCSIGFILMPHAKNPNNTEIQAKEVPTMTFIDMLKSPKAWNLFFLMGTSLNSNIYIQAMYKVLGMIYINDDHFISYIGSAGFAVACIGRLTFGALYDRYSVKRILTIDLLLVIVFLITFNISFSSKFLFALYFIMLSFGGTAIYSGILLQGSSDFPRDKWIFTYVSIGLLPGFMVPYIFQRFITPIIGYFTTLLIISGITGISVVQILLHSEDTSSMKISPEKEELIE